MKTIALLALAALSGCCWFSPCTTPDEAARADLARTERRLADFSKTINAYYRGRGESVPATFDEVTYFAVLTAEHPSHEEVQEVKSKYRVRARAVAGGYAVVLCDPTTSRKLMEDLSCTTASVDLRTWDRGGRVPCEFEAEPDSYCR